MTTPSPALETLRLGLPKGRMQEGVLRLLGEAGVRVHLGSRAYRPTVDLPGFEAKMLKPQNIAEMLHLGSRDVGFVGADWVSELELDLVELVDTRLDPVRIVAAAPEALLEDGKLPRRHLVVASEYERITRRWMESLGVEGTFVRTFGATEVFPPEDADCIVDNTATGSTLAANHLEIVGELMRSSTRLYASRRALEDPDRRARIEHLTLLVESVLAARQRVMIELNVGEDQLEAVIRALPCMRKPTVARLSGNSGYAVKAAVPRDGLPLLVGELKKCGGTDLVVSSPTQIVP